MTTVGAPPGHLRYQQHQHQHQHQHQNQHQTQQVPPRGVHPRPQPVGSAPMRALQLLRESQPFPVRRQSMPIAFSPPPRAPPRPLPLIDKPGGGVPGKPSFAGKPPPPSTHRPLAMLEALEQGRRHSTGNVPGKAPRSSIRPPPPRGPRPPFASGGSAMASATTAAPDAFTATGKSTLQAARNDAARRRSSEFRAPPPGPPPPGRRQSSVLALSPVPAQGSSDEKPPMRRESSSALGINSTGQATMAAPAIRAAPLGSAGGEGKRGGGEEGGGGGTYEAASNGAVQDPESAARRVSFSKKRGPPPTGAPERENDIARSGANKVRQPDETKTDRTSQVNGVFESGSTTTPPKPNHPLPTLQQRRRSSQLMSGLGKPVPPRPPGSPPPSSPDKVRRYSISSEISGGYDFSRRMSLIGPPGGGGAQPSLSGGVVANIETKTDKGIDEGGGGDVAVRPSISAVNGQSGGVLHLSGSNNNGNDNGEEGRKQARPELEARAAVLWYNMGVTKQKERDAKGAVECYERAVNDGHAKAQHNLAAIYEKGIPGVPKDDVEAVRLFRLAAEQGLAESSYSLAMHLKFGLGVRQDDAQCVFYLEQASEQGLAKAMFNLGLMYEKRRGINQDIPEADLLEATRDCYEAAAEAGVTKAMVNLGVLYLSGQLPGRDKGEALGCFQRAADEGDLSGLWNLSLCYERGVGVAKDVVVAQALQRQCRDREAGAQPSVADGQPVPRAGSALGHPRRSSDPSPSFRAPLRNGVGDGDASGGTNATGGRPSEDSNIVDAINKGPRPSRRRSSSIPLATPPPPEGPPPPAISRVSPEDAPESTDQTAVAARSRKRSSSLPDKPLKYVSEHDGPLAAASSDHNSRRPGTGGPNRRRQSSNVSSAAITGDERRVADADAARREGAISPRWSPPPPRKRKDSLLLKPTPEAIARVKAAVDRRKKLQAAAASASSSAQG